MSPLDKSGHQASPAHCSELWQFRQLPRQCYKTRFFHMHKQRRKKEIKENAIKGMGTDKI